MMNKCLIQKIKKIPKKPGVYLFKDASGRIIYIGKAIDLRKRIQQHFRAGVFFNAPQPPLRLRGGAKNMVADIDWIQTKNENQAMILENQLIKKYQPRYNIQWRDDKSYFWVKFTQDEWPRVVISHKSKVISDKLSGPIGPFVSGRELRKTLRALRKIFPYRTCKNSYEKPCLQWHLGLCPAHLTPCHSRESHAKRGESGNPDSKPGSRVKPGMTKQLDAYLQSLQTLSRLLRLYAGEKIRIEAYDISNIQGKYATGSMIVFRGDKPSKADYRKFRIKTVQGANDVAMLKEVLSRRLNHPEWSYPDLMLIDGGRPQLHVATNVTKVSERSLKNFSENIKPISIVALAKHEEEIYTEYSQRPLKINQLPESLRLSFQAIRDEAHRFAIFYYRYLHKQVIASRKLAAKQSRGRR